jgi:integration host factor subunit alpha
LDFVTSKEKHTMALTKAQLVETIQNQTGFPKNRSSAIVETLLELIKDTLISGEDVLISNFGKFSVNYKKERRGRNPATGDDMMLASRKVVTFKCSGKLRDRINSG